MGVVLKVLLVIVCASPTASGAAGGGGECLRSSGVADRRVDRRSLTLATVDADRVTALHPDAPTLHGGEAATGGARLHAVARVVAELNADVVHLVNVEEGCGALRQVVAAAVSVDPRSSSDYRPYLVKGLEKGTPARDGTLTVGMLTRVDPFEDLGRAADWHVERPSLGGPASARCTDDHSPPAVPHYFARLRVGVRNVTVAFVDGFSPADRADRTRGCGGWETRAVSVIAAALARARRLGDEVVVMGDVSGDDVGEITTTLDGEAFEDASKGATGRSSGVLARLLDVDGDGVDDLVDVIPMGGREGVEGPRRSGRVLMSQGLIDAAAVVEVQQASELGPTVVRVAFRPGRFTGEEETWGEYWTARRVRRVCVELVFAVVFFSGVVALAQGEKGPPTFADRFFGFGHECEAATGERRKAE